MSELNKIRLNKVIREFNISLERIVEFLSSNGHEIEPRPTTKISQNQYDLLVSEFSSDRSSKVESHDLTEEKQKEKEELRIKFEQEKEEKSRNRIITSKSSIHQFKKVGEINLNEKTIVQDVKVEVNKNKDKLFIKDENQSQSSENLESKIHTKYEKLSGLKKTGEKINLDQFKKSEADDDTLKNKRKRRRIAKDIPSNRDVSKTVISKQKKIKSSDSLPNDDIVQKQIRETLEKLQTSSKSNAAKYRKEKRDSHKKRSEDQEKIDSDKKIIQVTEFITVGEVASMMEVSGNDIISACMSLGIMVTMNQRLDAETLSVVADEFGFEVDFVTAEIEESIQEDTDSIDDHLPRTPIVTVMGHVDHGKTSLLDYIRNADVTSGEAGGITQHIGAYSVKHNKKLITFLDTPGHEAFTAMRARGAQVSDVAIIIIAADDRVMPQTKEAINHAQAAGVPMVFALNKCDRPSANPDKIKEELSAMNILVEDWGGKYQCQEISAKSGNGIEDLLEKVLLESELLEHIADPETHAKGTVIEASLDKGRGFVTTLLVQYGTLTFGNSLIAGTEFGKIKAMHDENGRPVKEAGPSRPVSVLGMNGASSAGDVFNVMTDEKEIKQIALKRQQLQREQGLRTTKHITLDEIGRRIALGDFQELNVIVKGDVDGSIEALSDSLLKLSQESIQINVIHKAVGQITESDILLASASDAIVIGFQVRPSAGARKLAEKEEIDIRLYSIIYKAIEEIKEAMEGMLSPEFKEEIVATAEIRETFKISKVGTIAGCYVVEGKINRKHKVRIIRDGIVVYSGELGSLKRFKDDVKEVQHGYECGLNIDKFNDIKVGDVVEAYEEVEVNRKL